MLGFADHLQSVRRDPARKAHMMHLAIARDFHLEPLRKRIHALRPDAVQTAGIFIGTLPEFSARVQIREHQLNGWNLPLWMNVHRDPAAIVPDRHRTVDVDRYLDMVAETRQML